MFVTEVLEQPANEVLYITSWQYVNDMRTLINKESKLVDVDVTPPRGDI